VLKFFNRDKGNNMEKGAFLNTKTIALIIALTAVTVILNPRFSGIAVPSFIPSLWFQIWEIAIVTAFFLLGIKSAVLIAIINAAVLQAVSPGAPYGQPIANLVGSLSMLLGVYVAYKFLGRRSLQETRIPRKKLVSFSTLLGIITRLLILMPFLYGVALFLGMSGVIMLFPLFVLYDLIVALYTIPLGYLLATVVNKSFRLSELI
jgi:hypothetical protein